MGPDRKTVIMSKVLLEKVHSVLNDYCETRTR